MAKSYVWKDLSEQKLGNIRHPHPKKGFTGRDLLAQYNDIRDVKDPRNEIHLDLYVHTLQFGQSLQFDAAKLSGLFSIVKDVHLRSIREQLAIESSFSIFKSLILQHSVHRPPFSIGLFSYTEMRRIMDWMLDSYYKHYKLYQYAYTNRISLSTTTIHPLDTVELPFLTPPLEDAMTEGENQARLAELAKEKEKEAAAAIVAAAAAAEQTRLTKLREEYKASVPIEVKKQVEEGLERELDSLRKAMESKFEAQHQAALDRLAALEASRAPVSTPPQSAAPKRPA
eukprot:CAMPEP_0175072598 /NCGR_PEP_ID=MMETSP0052_2-20121109/20011_1 /TAXON_ID=51329 ORGANISM="Polytomella parva, Strain SAG 63-3" /NCGR_SAMPLE_ID=MMETSP0052_2 /ASSEMBLY_ACC=CAM_ASM_000194 /LENGTH=283 /DNA_ID=CAMNT_0016340145 /DNA_START=65 /DNA_END=916 /DNA_ORIENTATION=+